MSAAAPPSPRSLVLASGASEGESEGLDPLVARAKEGDQAAFQALFRQHRDAVARTVHRFLGPSADLEDVVQDVFVHVYRSLPSFRGDAKFTTWLYRLTANVTKMHLRRARSRPRFADVQVPEATDDATAGRPDELVERNERVAALYRLPDCLSDKKRTARASRSRRLQAAETPIVDCPVLTNRNAALLRADSTRRFAEEPAPAALMELLEELWPSFRGD
ncbi:MAG: sigma-70 family RNA polymerase sigma factor [Sandaracinus sp.]|nr:sigma-70 family RNA polymerase sigma factor [Sandaracinus sp.]